MRLRGLSTVLLLLAAALPRYGTAATELERWVAARGPLLMGPAQVRAEMVLRSVHPCADTTPLRVHVLDTRDVGAFAWPQGDIVVTAALLELLDDDELAAALAHEVGHLLSDGHLGSAATLVGRPSRDEAEAAADELAIRLLADGGRDAGVMRRMLTKVQAALGPYHPDFRALGRRLQLLQRTF